jgi:hypothetical protein
MVGVLVVAMAVCAAPVAFARTKITIASRSSTTVSASTAVPSTATSATITPSLSPDRFGARASLTLTIHYVGGEFDVPSPVRRSVLRLPAGMSLDVPSLHSCSVARLRTRGAGGCPARSRLGAGYALVEAREGSQTIVEYVALSAFLGPPDNLVPTFEILAQGDTPVQESLVLTGSVLLGNAPYGEALVMSIPPIPTLPDESDASIVTLSLTVGAGRRRTGDRNAVLVPFTCPAGGFPFATEFTYADGSDGEALARVPCPS